MLNAQEDYAKIEGGILNSSNEPIPYASIGIKGTFIGTACNADGDFIIKFPAKHLSDTLGISCLGYMTKYIPVKDIINKTKNIIILQPSLYTLKEVVITNREITALDIVKKAVNSIPYNYETEECELTGFCRQLMYGKVSGNLSANVYEYVIGVYKPAMEKNEGNLIKIIKARQIKDVRSKSVDIGETVGLAEIFSDYDIVKKKQDLSFLDEEKFRYYNYEFVEKEACESNESYIISYKPKGKIKRDDDEDTYKGTIYIDKNTFAITKINGENLILNSLYMLPVKFLTGTDFTYSFQTNYHKMDNNKWYPDYSYIEVNASAGYGLLDIEVNSELKITDIKKKNISKYKPEEVCHMSGDLSKYCESVDTYDKNFWGNYNTIPPNSNYRKYINMITKKTESQKKQKNSFIKGSVKMSAE